VSAPQEFARPTPHDLLLVDVVEDGATPRALLVHLVGDDEANSAWLPRSEISVEPLLFGRRLRITAPRWLLESKGLVAAAGADQGRLF
jgi:hypothetical protein